LMQQLPPGHPKLVERAAYLDSVVDQTFEAAHRIASNLRPAALDLGIVAALDWQLQRFAHNTHIATQFSAPDAPVPLDADAATAVFRIVQEALTNVAKHAHATRVKLKLVREPDSLLLTLADNGRGIQPAGKSRGRPGFGLLGMRERAATLGGTLSVEPAKRGGTQISLCIPFPAPTPAK
ncbi:MAG: sensor histidine kinase, partial [Gammaproteobacteria bacterium]